MSEQPYDSEDVLQSLLERYPNLLASDQGSDSEERRWALVSREAGVASEPDGSARWSVDHVFLDQDGIPTLVEVKRSSDTRIRREVVGQMLDYAANAVVYWPVESMRASFDETCAARGESPEETLAELIGPDTDVEAFWQKVRTNLQAGRIRMVFVADEIPPELQRIVEFLNGQMSSAEVLAIEIKQYVGEGRKTLAPRVIGQTAAAQQAKGARGPKRQWDERSFFAELEEKRGAEEARIARELLAWARERLPRFAYGQGRTVGSLYPTLDYKGESFWPIGIWTSGLIELEFQWLQYRAPFDDEDKRRELLGRFNQLPGVSLPDDVITRRPSIPLAALTPPEVLAGFLKTLDWVVEEIQAT